MCSRIRCITSSSLSPRAMYPHSQLICFAIWTSFGPVFVGPRHWGYVGDMLVPPVRIQVCGPLAVELDGRRIDRDLPGRQGRLLLAYLVLHRLRPVRRDELGARRWPGTPPPGRADTPRRALIPKRRKLLPSDMLEGRAELRLSLPADAFVDLEDARE